MKVQGSVEVALSREAVFERLLDPEFLQRCIPRCESIEEIAPGRFEIAVSSTISGVRGSFKGTVTLSDVVRPESYTLTIEGKTPVGKVRSVATVGLEESGDGTRLHYQGEAKFSGLFARVGARLLEPMAHKLTGEFFERLARELG